MLLSIDSIMCVRERLNTMCPGDYNSISIRSDNEVWPQKSPPPACIAKGGVAPLFYLYLII